MANRVDVGIDHGSQKTIASIAAVCGLVAAMTIALQHGLNCAAFGFIGLFLPMAIAFYSRFMGVLTCLISCAVIFTSCR